MIGDVVGLGKTLMATALARVFEDDHGLETLIICPKNLVPMWEDYREQYRMRARVLSISRAIGELADMRRYRLVLIDESHNLRNREGKRYRAIKEYIRENDSKCILLSATPYNKTYLDLSSQLRLFVPEDDDLGIRPERLLREIGETEFIRRHQASVRSLAAFEKSEYADDWRELMRLYLVRRTRSFIQDNYAETDPTNGRKYLTFEDGSRSYFPVRLPERQFRFDNDPTTSTPGSSLTTWLDTINGLELPRYGLGNYVAPAPHTPPTPAEAKILDDLSRAGQTPHGVLPDQFVQTAREQRTCVPTIRRAAHSPKLHIPARHRERATASDRDTRMRDCWIPDSTTRMRRTRVGDIFDTEEGEETSAPGGARQNSEPRRISVSGLLRSTQSMPIDTGGGFAGLAQHHFVREFGKDLHGRRHRSA